MCFHAVTGIYKLRSTDREKFKASPEMEAAVQRLADVMKLYLDEANRLQVSCLAYESQIMSCN